MHEKKLMDEKRLNRINDFMQNEVDNGLLAGISALVAHKNEIVHFAQCGYQDRDAKTLMSENTLFRVYSMTKPIVSAAVMILFERGLFSLHDPIEKYIPCFANMKVMEVSDAGEHFIVDAAGPITIHQLLTHTSGLAYNFYDDNPACATYRDAKIFDVAVDYSLKDIVEKIAELPLAYHPGEQFYYSVSIDVLAYLIEVLTSESLQDFLQQEMFTPLGMNDTYFCVPEDQRSRVAKCYGGADILKSDVQWGNMMTTWVSGKNDLIDVNSTDPINDPVFARGGFGLKMTMQDYYKFAKMLLNNGAYEGGYLLSPKTIELMRSNHLTEKQMPVRFQEFILGGLGFGLGGSVLMSPPQAEMLGSKGNFGWSGAAKTHFWIDPKEELVAIFMAQGLNNFALVHPIFQNLVYQALLD